MKIINNCSIKSKLSLLIFIPLSLLIIASVWKINSLASEISDLSSIEGNLRVGNKVMDHLLLADQLRLNKLHQENKESLNVLLTESRVNKDKIMLLTSSLVADHRSLEKKEILSTFTTNLADINEAFLEVDDFDQNDIAEWSSWVVEDIAFELFLSLEKLNVHTRMSEVNQKLRVINQLRWIMFYALQENWLIQVVLEKGKFEEIEDLRASVAKEDVFIERFLTLNANKQQIELLLETFQKEGFQKSLQYKENILAKEKGFFDNQDSDDVRKVLEQRLLLMLDLSQSITEKTSIEITDSIHTVKKDMYIVIATIVVVILLILLLGINVVNRIFIYLQSTIEDLEKIEAENDYSILISEEGRDEFAHFSSKLNYLIAERKLSTGKMMQAKEDAEHANKAKSYFLANMSHEIRTPLNGILGMYQILAATELSHSQKNHLETIHQSSKTLLMLINDILDISKIESGNLSLSEVATDFREAIYETMSMVSSKGIEKSLKLSVSISPDLPTYLILDEHRLRQVIMNLLSNAIKFTAKGKVELIISGDVIENKCRLHIAVIDTGIGIAKENQDAIFKPFVQEDGSITREFGGTGLGLAISDQLVHIMGGDLACESEKGKGTMFFFDADFDISETKQVLLENDYDVLIIGNDTSKVDVISKEFSFFSINRLLCISYINELPVNLSKSKVLVYCQSSLMQTQADLINLLNIYPDNPVIVIQETSDEQYDFRDEVDGQMMLPLLGKRCLKVLKEAVKNKNTTSKSNVPTINTSMLGDLPILVFEDNLVNQKVVSFFLTSFGYEFVIAENGRVGLDKVKEGLQVSAILMDCMMPVMDGFTATGEIRKFEKENGLNPIPILALTASVFDEDIKQCYEAGMNDYIAKPIDKAVLESKLTEYICQG